MRPLLLTLPIAVAVLAPIALAGCGTEQPQPARQAAGATTCPTATDALTREFAVHNLLPVPVRVSAQDMRCDEWSGTGNPAAQWDGRVVAPGATERSTLALRRLRTQQWTIVLTPDVAGAAAGTAAIRFGRAPTGGLSRFLLWSDSERRWGFSAEAGPSSPDWPPLINACSVRDDDDVLVAWSAGGRLRTATNTRYSGNPGGDCRR